MITTFGFNDGGSGESDLAAVSGELQDQSASGDCGGGNAFPQTWNIVEGYDGQTYEDEAKCLKSLHNGQIMKALVESGSFLSQLKLMRWAVFPASIANGDDGEDYDQHGQQLAFEVSMEPVLNIDDPTTE